jgi:hypothetical protein
MLNAVRQDEQSLQEGISSLSIIIVLLLLLLLALFLLASQSSLGIHMQAHPVRTISLTMIVFCATE